MSAQQRGEPAAQPAMGTEPMGSSDDAAPRPGQRARTRSADKRRKELTKHSAERTKRRQRPRRPQDSRNPQFSQPQV